MKLPQYITIEEVQRVCRELGFRDWTELSTPEVLQEEARLLQAEIEAEAQQIPLDEFRKGLEIELEHGLFFPDANVTNNHPVLTGRIVLAHLKEMLDYYSRLEVAELEGDMLKAVSVGDLEKLRAKYRQLLAARLRLNQLEVDRQSA